MMIAEKIRRLGEMDLPEVRFRVAQKLRIAAEQCQLAWNGENRQDPAWWRSWDAGNVNDSALCDALKGEDVARIATLLPEYFINRKAPMFYWNLTERKELVDALRKLFPHGAEQLQAAADAICGHRFRIFAYPEVSCGPQIPWRRDLIHGVESGLEHYARIPILDFPTVGDSKNVWEINRHQHFITLGQAYLMTGSESLAEECLSQWEDWVQENPHLRGINWASSLEVAFRSWSWVWTLYLFMGSRALTGDRIGRITHALSRNARFIAKNLSTYFASNTHLLGEGFALFVVGLLFPELNGSKAWLECGQRILIEEMEKQVGEDGSHFEQSTFYHRYAVEFFLCAAILGNRNGRSFPARFYNRLEKMLEFSVHTAWPSGTHPPIGDSDGGTLIPLGPFEAKDQRSVLSTGAVFFRRGDFRKAAASLHEQTLWLLGTGSDVTFAALDPTTPSTTSRIFSNAGLVTMRSEWSERSNLLMFDVGPQGMKSSGHGHADSLSVVCAANGVEWLIDPGTYVYSASRPWRAFFCSTSAHNTIAVDGHDQAVHADWFKWRKLPHVFLEQSYINPCVDYAVGVHNGYARLHTPVLHRRRVIFVKPHYWIISDELAGQGHHKVTVFFHFGPGISVQQSEKGWIATKGPERFLLAPLSPGMRFRVATGEESPIQGWYSADYGHRERACVVVGEIETSMPVQFRWLLWPVEDEMPIIRESHEGSRLLTVQTQAKTDVLMFAGNEATCLGEETSTDAAFAFLRDNSEVTERVVLIGGSSLVNKGKPILTTDKACDHFVANRNQNNLEIEMKPLQPFRLNVPPAPRVQINGERRALRMLGGAFEFVGEQ
jgi:Heparinase II/III-like protein/Heparinase II/III N-terminus